MFIISLLLGVCFAAGIIVILRLSVLPPKVSLERFTSERLVATEKGIQLQSGATGVRGLIDSTSERLEGTMESSSKSATQLRKDLAMIGRTRRKHAEIKLFSTIGGAVFGLLLGLALTQVSINVPYLGVLVVLLAIMGGGAGFALPDSIVKSEAAKLREEFEEMMLLWLDLVMPLIASGRDVSSAFLEATYLSKSWAFQLLGRYMNEARHLGQPVWMGLKKLKDERGIGRLDQLTSALELSQRSGAEIRQTVIAQVESYRSAAHSEAVVKAEFASERMGAPLALTLAAFIVLIGYPAMATLTGSGDVFNLPSTGSLSLVLPPFVFG